MLCRPLTRGAGLERGQVLNELRLTLAGEPIEASGAVHGARLAPDGRLDFLIMFDERRLNEKGKSVMIEYICRRQADFVDSESRAYAEEASTADEAEPAVESREDGPDDKLNQDLMEELEAVQSELDEINGLPGKKGAIKS